MTGEVPPDSSGLIEDRRVLEPTFVPREVVHRDGEVDHLASVLAPLTREGRADTALLTGPSGTGKTCIAQFTIDRLTEEVPEVRSQYVNCWQYSSREGALSQLFAAVDSADDRSLRPGEQPLMEHLDRAQIPPWVVLLDEADHLADKSFLYELHQHPAVSLILIAKREIELFAEIGDRLASRLRGSERIQFDRYSRADLVAILEARVEHGLAPDAITRADLERVAGAAAGDARIALGLLRSAVRRADRAEAPRIPAEIVRHAIAAAQSADRQEPLAPATAGYRPSLGPLEAGDASRSPGDAAPTRAADISSAPDVSASRQFHEPPFQKLVVDGPGAVTDRVYPVYRRARLILANADSWGASSHDGGYTRIRFNAAEVREYLTGVSDDTTAITSEQVKRAFQKIVDLGRDCVRPPHLMKDDDGVLRLSIWLKPVAAQEGGE